MFLAIVFAVVLIAYNGARWATTWCLWLGH